MEISFEKKNTSRLIIEYIFDEIEKGNIKKGDKLLTEKAFCEQFDISRIPLREALGTLNVLGYIKSRQGGGSKFTNECDTELLGKMLYTYAILEGASIENFLHARFLLEPEFARLAAQSSPASKKRIVEISKKYSKLAESNNGSSEDIKALKVLDNDFHHAVASSANNSFLELLFSVTLNSFENFQVMREHSEGSNTEKKAYWKKLAKEHQAIAKAISDGKEEEAYEKMLIHLKLIRDSFKNN